MTTDDNIEIDEATISWDVSAVIFTQTPDWILNNDGINDGAFRTWMAIASFASNKTHTAFPSARKLMEMRGKGRRIIFEHIRQLEAAGLLVREARYRPNGGRTSSHYTLAWNHPLGAVQQSAPPPSAANRTPPDAANRAESHAENRAPRTRTNPELDPLPPQPAASTTSVPNKSQQGATAPRTPRSSRQRQRENGTNPRAVESQAAKEHQMRSWARNMNGPLTHDEFVEHVDAEIRAGTITAAQGAVATEESARLSTPVSTPISRP